MANAEEPVMIHVIVAFSPQPRTVDEVRLQVPSGATVAEALQASGVLARHGLAADETLSAGIWGKTRPLDALLREADRVEVWRQLRVDPKEARRQRYRKQTPKA